MSETTQAAYDRSTDIIDRAAILWTVCPPMTGSVRDMITEVADRLRESGDGTAAGIIDGLMVSLKQIARHLETHGGNTETAPLDAYRVAMAILTD